MWETGLAAWAVVMHGFWAMDGRWVFSQGRWVGGWWRGDRRVCNVYISPNEEHAFLVVILLFFIAGVLASMFVNCPYAEGKSKFQLFDGYITKLL